MTEEHKAREVALITQAGNMLTNYIRAAVRAEHARYCKCDPSEVEVYWQSNGLLDAVGPEGEAQEYGYEVRHVYAPDHHEPVVRAIPS